MARLTRGELVRAALTAIVEGRTLTLEEARGAMGAVMDGEATASQLAALLMGLRMRGETTEELAGFAAAMVRLASSRERRYAMGAAAREQARRWLDRADASQLLCDAYDECLTSRDARGPMMAEGPSGAALVGPGPLGRPTDTCEPDRSR